MIDPSDSSAVSFNVQHTCSNLFQRKHVSVYRGDGVARFIRG